MLKFADLIEKHLQEIVVLDSITMGGPVGPQSVLVGAAAATFRCEFSAFGIAEGAEANEGQTTLDGQTR
jgi:hypothetical protein